MELKLLWLRGTPDSSQSPQLRSHAATSSFHLCRGKGSMLFFPLGHPGQTCPPLQCFPSRNGHPGRDAYLVAGSRGHNTFVNFRVYGYRKLR